MRKSILLGNLYQVKSKNYKFYKKIRSKIIYIKIIYSIIMFTNLIISLKNNII